MELESVRESERARERAKEKEDMSGINSNTSLK